MSIFTEWLKDMLREKKISQHEMAERINATQAQVCHWLKEDTLPRMETIENALAEFGYHLEIVKDEFDRKETAEVEIEGSAYFWWYVCGECHVVVKKGAEKCPCCRRWLIWE